MSEWIEKLFVSIFGTNSEIATFIISMIPIVELRGAIPFGSAVSMWGENALPVWKSFLLSIGGSSLICVVLTFLFMPILNWLKKTRVFMRFANWIENKLSKNSEKINNNANSEKDEKKKNLIKWWGVFVFVSIPLPLTGVWTGTAIALFIGMNWKQTLSSVILGNCVAGLIMMAISYIFKDNTMIVFLIFLALVVVFVLFALIKNIINKRKHKSTELIVNTTTEE